MITEYIDYLQKVAGYSRHTCQAYKNDLQTFAKWVNENVPDGRWSNICQYDIECYIKHLTSAGYEPASTNRALSALRGIFRWFIREGLLSTNPAKNVLPRKEEKRVPATIGKSELAAVFNAADEDTKAIIMVLYSTGIRIQELLEMKWEHIDWTNGAVLISGKGGKQRYVYLQKGVLSRLEKYQNEKNASGLIFPFGQRAVRRMISNARTREKVTCSLSPHIIRHTTATEWAKNGASNVMIANALGHSRIETSKKYIDLAQLDTRAMMVSNIVLT